MAEATQAAYGSCVVERLEHLVRTYGDAALAASITALLLLQIWLLNEPIAVRVYASAIAVGMGVLLALRTRMPLALLVLLVAQGVVQGLAATALPAQFGDLEAFGFVFLLSIYTAAAHTSGRRARIAAALTISMGAWVAATDPESLNVAAVVFFALLTGAPWVAGRIVRRRRVNEERLEREKVQAEAAIVEERSRIARELHDVVAHAISVIVLQARGGRKLLDSEPAEARVALDAIERTASQALAEMRRMLELLREGDEQLALAPQPSLSQLDLLAERVRAAGLPVEVQVRGEPVGLPPGVDLSAYRIVQEALTNALKHAGPAKTRVIVDYEPGELVLEIADDGTGEGNGAGTGHGLAGIRERVSLFGGDVEAGPRSEGGYAVRVRLPYSSER